MALTLEAAQRMTQAAEQNGVQLLCGHTASLMAANQAMRRLITSGEIGDVKAINVWGALRRQPGGGRGRAGRATCHGPRLPG